MCTHTHTQTHPVTHTHAYTHPHTKANVMINRCVLMMYLCFARNIGFILEQPSSTLAHMVPRFQELLRAFPGQALPSLSHNCCVTGT